MKVKKVEKGEENSKSAEEFSVADFTAKGRRCNSILQRFQKSCRAIGRGAAALPGCASVVVLRDVKLVPEGSPVPGTHCEPTRDSH